MTAKQKTFPIMPIAADAATDACAGAEPYALMVLGDSMLPEFAEGDIVVVEPEGLALSGSFVVAVHAGEHILRQLVCHDVQWFLHPLNPRYADAPIAGLAVVRGVVIQKSVPGSRRAARRYVA